MTPYYDHGGIVIYHGNCLDVLPTLTDGSVDHLITDPPYSEHVHSNVRSGNSKHNLNGTSVPVDLGFESLSAPLRLSVCCHVARLVRRWALVFCAVEECHHWNSGLESAGLEHIRTGAWIKQGATPQFTGDRPAQGFESIEIAHRSGKKKWNGGGKHAVWTFMVERGADRVHTTQKPLGLMSALVAQFTDPGELVLDPFGGSGTTALACKNLGRRCTLVEREERYCEAAALRLSQELLALEVCP